MNLRKKVSSSELYTEYVRILNGVLHLSAREAEVFSFIVQADTLFSGNINSKALRKVLLNQLGISDANLSKYLRVIKDKGLIVRGTNRKWVLNKNIRPEIKTDFVDGVETKGILLNITLELKKEKEDVNDRMENGYKSSSGLEG